MLRGWPSQLSGPSSRNSFEYYPGMSKPSKLHSFMGRVKRQRSIKRPIASDVWTFTDGSGKKRRAELTIGKPRPVPGGRGWYCEIRISGWLAHVFPAMGAGPFDSLDNAMKLIRAFEEDVAHMHITAQSYGHSRRRSRAI